MAYSLTPAERRERAQSLVQQRKNVVAYNKYLKQQKDYEKQVAQAELDEENRQKQIESQDFFTRAISTVGDISANIITGALKGLEGIYDLGAGIVGAVGGIFSNDFQDSVKSHIATDWVGKYIGDPLQELTKYSYTKNGGIIEGVASGVGQMLPAVAVTIATGGAGASAAVSQMASLATLGASAAGNSTEEAYNDGASYYAGLGYGLASGAVEVATEKMWGGFGKLTGSGYLDNVTKSIAKQGVARVAKEAVQEGIEEVVSELANPALKSIYKGGEAFQEYGDSEYWKGVGQAGLIGGLTSMAYGQSIGRVLHTTGKYADVNEVLSEVDTLQKKAQNLAETGKLYETSKNGKTNSDNIHDSMVANLRLVEQTVQKVDESKRASFIKKAGLSEVMNTDGTIKPEYAMSRGLTDMVAQQSTEGDNSSQSPLASQPKQYRTAFADERVLQEALDSGKAKAFTGEMTTEQAADFKDFTKVFAKLANKSNGSLKFVVAEEMGRSNAYIDPKSGTIVIGIDQFGKGTSGVELANAVITSDMWQKSVLHEIEHSTEGTKKQGKLASHLFSDTAVEQTVLDEFIDKGYLEHRTQDKTAAREYIENLIVKYNEAIESKPRNVSYKEWESQNFTAEERADIDLARSELAALAAENVLGNEDFIKKLLRKETNTAQKVINRIMDMKEAFASLKSKEARSAYTYLQKAEKLYLKAIEEVGARFQNGRIIGIRRREEGEAVDANPQTEYNGEVAEAQQSRKDSLINHTFPTYKEGKGTQANELAMRWAHRADIQAGDKNLISYNGDWYVIEKFDSSDSGYQIIEKISEKQYQSYLEEFENGNRQKQSIQKGVSRITSLDRRRNSSIGEQYSVDSSPSRHGGENSQIQRVGEEQSQRGKTSSNGSGDSESRRSSKQRLKYSLKSVEPVQPTSKTWTPTIDTDEALKRFPNLWNVKAEESEVRNPTQIKGTVSTYRKIYDILKKEGFEGKILDASSGLGYGTQAGIDEYGFNVEDIEPYPDSKYKPKYTDYSSLDEKYDVIISNAVLNVLPQDQRDALVVKMGELLNVGGRLFVNVRGDDVNNLSSNPANVKIGEMEWYVAPTGSYQKGFTRAELVAYLQDALGKNFSVVPTTQFGKTSAIVTKKAEGIKYSLKVGDESISGTVEETKNLVALHNLSEAKLMKVLELGGFPMPSIAVTKADLSHDDFGDITVIFGRDTIDPQQNRDNKVFSKDGWTPTVPPVEYKPNEKALKRISDKYSSLVRKIGYDAARPLYKYVNDIERVLESSKGEIGMLAEIYEDTDIMNLFLYDTGRELVDPIQKEVRTELSEGDITFSKALIEQLGEDFLAQYKGLDYEGRKDFLQEHKEKIVEAFAFIMQGSESLAETKQMIENNFSIFGLGTRLNKANRYLENGGITTRQEVDSSATQEAIRKATPKEEYREWVDSIFSGIQEKVGIRNGVDPYTRSGNRKSFEATHYDYTLDNIVEAMRGEDMHGAGWVHGLTLGELSAKLAKEFKSIDEIRQSSDSLKKADENAHEEFSETTRKMLDEITSEMVDENRYSDTVDLWTAYDSASVVIGEIADQKLFTLEKIAAYMKREYQSYRYNDSIGNKILGLFEYVRRMTDTDYFEAKPRRAVGFEEIKRVLLPEATSKKLINALQEKGIEYQIYSSGESRSSIIQRMDDIKFSRKDSQGRSLSEGQAEFFQDSQVRDEKGNLLVMYHGTESKFYAFNMSKRGSNGEVYGVGYYFVADKDSAKSYGKNVIEAYLNLKKPVSLNSMTISRDEWNTFLKFAKAHINEYLSPDEWQGNTLYVDSELRQYSDYSSDTELIKLFINSISGGNQDVTEAYLKMLTDSIGYDGVFLNNSLAVVFNPNQIKLVTNANPTDNIDIRLSRKASDDASKPTYYHLSDGQIKKMLANNTRYKVYSKADAERIINNVLQNYMSFGEKYGEISGKTRAEVIDMLWKGLNSAKPGYQMGVALNIADYIIQNSVLENLCEDYENAHVQQALDIIGALKPYLHRINLDSIKGEIKYKYDKDNSAYLLWGKRKGDSGLGADQIAMELETQGIFIDAINEAEIFFEIDAQYRNAVKALKKSAKEMLAEALPKEQLKSLKQEIAREILQGYDYTGKSSKLSEVLDKYRKQISTLYDKLRDSDRHNRATNRLLDKVQKIKNWKTGAFVNSSKYRTKLFKGSIERLALIKNRGNLNQSGTRRIIAGLAEWYTKDNPLFRYVDVENVGQFNQEIADILQAVAQNQKPLTDEQIDLISYLQERSGISDYKGLLEWYTKENLKKGYSAEVKSLLRELASETTFTTEELIALEKAVGYFGNLIENYNKIVRNGKYVDAKPISEGYIETLERNKRVKVGWIGKLFEKVFNNGKASYLQTFADPMTVARYMDKYERGFYTEMLEELRNGAIRADVTEMNIRLPLEEFLTKHKKYAKGVSKRTVTYRGVEMPATDAFLLYMTLNREQALAGLAESGFTFNNGKETIRVDGFAKGIEGLTLDELRDMAKTEQDELFKQFTEEDKEYILIAEKIFNEDCREAKRATDMLRFGYSNVFEGYYVPIRRANSAISVDTSTFFDEMNRVSNASFNKDTVQGAKGELIIEGLDEVLDRHIHGVSQYAALATVIDQYDILYNLNVTEDANKPTTVRTESENTWAKGNDYFKKLISDIQGISPTKGGGKLFGFLRGSYAKYQLGLNPKVWVTQLSSLFASSSILDYSSIIKGFGIKTPDVDDYCSLAAVRNNDNSAAMAQSVLDKVDKFGSALMKPIGKVDRFVVKRLFGACQVQVQKESGLKVGTSENKVKAGELLQRVILETQQNSMATERSAAMRSGSEMMKTLTMFTADSMKVFGRVVDSIGEVSVLKHKINATADSDTKSALQTQLKQATKNARKSVTALAATAIFMALVAQGFRWLYDKDDDDENAFETMTVDAIGNLMGGLPLIKDLYAKLTEGYDLNNYSYSAINDLFDAFASIVNFSEGKPAQKVKNIVYAVGQLLGIPTRNVYNIIYGLTKRFSPTTAYEIDNAFYNKNYSSDLQNAIDNDDEEMIATIAGIMVNERVGDIESEQLRKELNSLVSDGYSVLPKSIGDSITYNGEEIALTSRQKEQFKNIYSEANGELASLVEGKAYKSATEEVKAKAIAFIWDIYYNLAIEDLLGVDLETKNTLFAKAIDIPSLAIIVATARGLEADTDKNGKVISGSKKAKVQGYINSLGLKATQKYMIMGYLGYTNKNGESQVRSYIQRLRLSKSEKEKLFEYSGYAA